ncbi:unnamed protein product [Durusdinium trenchii]|uniref:EF-hand domain-containing protein n=2 Tax=Durusdinium trenchii TaxID=1381693 RepID=A0ABP0SKI5_9DINO
MQERYAEQAHEDWRRDVSHRLTQIRQKPRLNDALNVLVYQLKRDGLTEGELFERIDANKDGELSKSELQSALRKLGVSLSTSELDGILRIFDSDGSGSIAARTVERARPSVAPGGRRRRRSGGAEWRGSGIGGVRFWGGFET